MSIVLVIIGLIIGGVLVGQDLIAAAATRATIAQIEKYNTTVNTFVIKFGYLPGDIPNPYAGQFGFQTRGNYAGEGDGNGIIESVYQDDPNSNCGQYVTGGGEIALFWDDLSAAKLVEGGFTPATIANVYVAIPPAYSSISQFLPPAKLGNGNYVYVWSGGVNPCGSGNGKNYFGITSPFQLGPASLFGTSPGITVAQAYNIDKKIDDGLPQSGKVTASYVNYNIVYGEAIWAAGGGAVGTSPGGSATGTTTTCYDNGGGAGPMQYSMTQNNGANVNCALSFQMQGAAR